MIIRKFTLIVFLSFIGFSQFAFAQSLPILEQNPTALRWYQIQTPKFRIIYPQGFEQEAQRTANTLETIYKPVSRTLEKEPRGISIILQNQTAVSNGFVTLTPRHSEFFTVPPQDYSLLGTNNWIDLLAVHEFRHVVQYDKALTGLSKIIYYVFGGNGLSATSFLAVPTWFWEGDAVGTETALTPGGRGRIPQFDLAFRTSLLTKGPYNYQKAYMRSYKDFVPNHYVLGYFITSHAKRKYGQYAWSGILKETYDMPFKPFAFSSSIRKETDLRVEGLYKSTIKEVDSLWRNQIKDLTITPADSLTTGKNRVFTNYEYPQYLTDGRILAQKSGLADIDKFVVVSDSAKEEKVFVPGLLNESGMLSVVNNKIVWSEQAFDPRWGMRNYTVIKTYDTSTKKLRQITHRSRLSAPTLSPDGRQIVAVNVSENSDYNLVILNSQTGEQVQKLNNPDNSFYLMPRWSPDGTSVVAVKLNKNGKTIEITGIATGTRRELMKPMHLNIAHPVWFGKYIYFNSPYNGIDNIYAIDTQSGEQFQVTSRQFGAYNPAISPDGSTIAFNDFTPDGFRIVTMPNNPTGWKPFSQVEDRTVVYYEPLVEQEGNTTLLSQVPNRQYPASKFSKFRHIFNPYSWSPLATSTGSSLSVSLSSQDLLSTALADIGLGYDSNEGTMGFFTRLSYQGLYPVLDAEYETRMRNTNVILKDQVRGDTTVSDLWREHDLRVGVRLPFNLTHSKYIESLNLSAYASVTDVSGRMIENRNGTLQAMRYNLTYRRLLKRSARDVNPRWGQTIALYYRHTPFGGDFDANLFATEGNLFFPGLLKHHSLRLRGGYQREAQGSVYPFSTPLFFPRGKKQSYSYTSHRDFYNGAVEYRFPIFNPDWTLGRWLFFKRFKGNAFFDFGEGQTATSANHYRTLGFDLTAEFHFMRLPIPLELGIRSMYLPLINKWEFQSVVIEVGF